MKEEDKRAVALNSLTSIGKEYVTLSDSTTIGKDVLKDLKKLMELELREKYKVNKTKWRVITKTDFVEDYYDNITSANETLVTELKKKSAENKKRKEELNKKINEYADKTDTDEYKRLKIELRDLEKYFTIDMVPDTPISFNTIVKLEENDWAVPYIELNKDPKEIATILNDKKELDKIFREKKFMSFDDMVILEFYNEITKKLSNTKDYLRKTDLDIRQDIIDDLYKKLFALYNIKEYNFKDKKVDEEDIKEEYIKKKIKRNNNLSIGSRSVGGMEVPKVMKESFAKKAIDTFTPNKEEQPNRVKRLALAAASPVAATVGLAADAVRVPVKKAIETVDAIQMQNIPSKIASKFKYAQDKIDNLKQIVTKVSNKYDEYKKGRDYLQAEKFLLLITGKLKGKDANTINVELNIDELKKISRALGNKSIYKKNIEQLININNSFLSSNREKLLKEQWEKTVEQSADKKIASGNFVLEAIDNYKKLKKSFVDKVNKDKDDIEKMLEKEVADEDFAENITFDNIVNSNSGTYIKKLKRLNSYLYKIDDKRGGNYIVGGATPMYNVHKLKNDDEEISRNTPLDYYKLLKDNYIEIVNQYYKLIDKLGGEEEHYKFLYLYESLGITDVGDDVTSKAPTINVDDTQSKKNLIQAYKLIQNRLKQAIDKDRENKQTGSLFTKDGEDGYPSTSDVMSKLAIDIANPEKKATIKYKEHFSSTSKWKKFSTATYTQALYELLNASIKAIDDTCQGSVDNCENILSIVKNIFDDTSINSENESKLNELNEKIQLIENRIKLLEEIILKLPKELEKLYKVMKNMNILSQATEYEDFVINILKRDKIEFFEKDKEKHPIIKALNNEKNEREDQLKKLKSQRDEAKKSIEDDNAIKKAEIIRTIPNIDDRRRSHVGGGSKNEKYKNDLKLNSNFLKENYYKTFDNLIIREGRENNLHQLMINLKQDVEYLENNDDKNLGYNKSLDTGRDKGIYEDIWYDYISSVDKKDNRKDRWKNYLLYLIEGEKVHDRVIQNNLDPEIVLKINFRDKSIYIFLMFLIRTINIISLEFLIEYNLIKSLQYAILLYGFMYLFIISLLVIIVNYDSYKLRILLNYLNIHINSSNLLLQNVLFIIFIVLVYILIKSDDFLKYFGYIFDYTNIYNNIYKFNESLNEDSDINLTQNEKLKLLYRIDIISMIIFIFSAFLVLVL